MQGENVFLVDRFVRIGMDCLVEGVKRPGSIYRTCRMTLTGGGFTYRLEGNLTPMQALELYAALPKPHDGLAGVMAEVSMARVPLDARQQAAIGRSFLPEWRLTVTECGLSARFVEGATYAAFDFGMLPPIVDPDRVAGTVDEPMPVAFGR